MKNEINKLVKRIGDDFAEWNTRCAEKESSSLGPEYFVKRTQEFRDGLQVLEGRKYIKIIKTSNGRSVWGFVVKEDGPKFRKGDILMAASWASPATNHARGNIFGEYQIQWTGPMYVR